MYKFWTNEEVQFIAQHKLDMTKSQIAKALGRTYKAVDGKMNELNQDPAKAQPKSPEVKIIMPETISTESYINSLTEIVKKEYHAKRFPSFNFKSNGKSKEILNLVISDVHVGKINTWYDTLTNKKIITYDDAIRSKFEKRYMESIARLLSLWQHGYFFEKLNIILLGDILDNDRIFRGQKTCISMSVGQQIWAIVAELADMFGVLSQYFPKVEVIGIVGNHGRSTSESKEEEPVENNFEYQLYKILQLMLQENKKITVTVPNSRFYSISNYAHKIFMSHGDTVRGYTISYAERKAKELLINLPEGYNLYCIGHRHRADRIALSPTAELLVNGCWIPYDDYAFKLYGVSTQPCQWCFGSSPHRVISSLCVPIDFRGSAGKD